MELVGIVRCPVSLLVPYGSGRLPQPQGVERLARLFNATKCNPRSERNHIQGIVTTNDLESILATLGTTKGRLADTIQSGNYPFITKHHIACLDGRHRLAAAKRKPFSCWVVKLLCVNGKWVDFPLKLNLLASRLASEIQDEVDRFSHETHYSDAEVYRLVQKHIAAKDEQRAAEVRARLSPPKEMSLKCLLKNVQIDAALKELLQFPGIIAGLQLGNFRKHLALHCDENIVHYLRERILHVWNFICNGDPRIKSKVDLVTVQSLQYRIPAKSESDRHQIDWMMDDGTIFADLEDPDLRDSVRNRILSLQVVIPSIETFQENMKYFSIGARILQNYVQQVPSSQRNQPTLLESLSKDWTAPSVAHLEVDTGMLRPFPEIQPTVQLAYVTIFLAAIRQFAELGHDRPRQDVRREIMPAFDKRSAVIQLVQLAACLGFDNAKIQENLIHTPGREETLSFQPKPGQPAVWRAGIPFTKTYLKLQSCCFLDQLTKYSLQENIIPPIFVLKDFVEAFFGTFDIFTTEATSEDQPPSSPATSPASTHSLPPEHSSFQQRQSEARDLSEEQPGSRPDSQGSRRQGHNQAFHDGRVERMQVASAGELDVTDSPSQKQLGWSQPVSEASLNLPSPRGFDQVPQHVARSDNHMSTFDRTLRRSPISFTSEVQSHINYRDGVLPHTRSFGSESTLRESMASRTTMPPQSCDFQRPGTDTFYRPLTRHVPLSAENSVYTIDPRATDSHQVPSVGTNSTQFSLGRPGFKHSQVDRPSESNHEGAFDPPSSRIHPSSFDAESSRGEPSHRNHESQTFPTRRLSRPLVLSTYGKHQSLRARSASPRVRSPIPSFSYLSETLSSFVPDRMLPSRRMSSSSLNHIGDNLPTSSGVETSCSPGEVPSNTSSDSSVHIQIPPIRSMRTQKRHRSLVNAQTVQGSKTRESHMRKRHGVYGIDLQGNR